MRRATHRGIAGLACAAGMLVTILLLAAAPTVRASPGTHPGEGSDAAMVRRIVARAERGDPQAQTMLGFMYATGRGVPQSYSAAVDWYTRSAHQGDPDGQYLLGLMYDKGFGVNIDVVKAYKWLNLAAAHASRRNRENYQRIRDAVASKMTLDQIDVAQKLTLEFIPTKP
jgi:uncharacterized protein